jgi:hypothetical protein
MKTPVPFLSLLVFAHAVQADPRTSASYSILTDGVDAGGMRTSSANYSNDGSASGIAGISTAAAPAAMAKHGFIAQLYEVAGLAVIAAAAEVNETETLQLDARLLLDDTTFLTADAAAVDWSVQSGPLTGIDAAGVATAGPVYQDTAATVDGTLAGFTGSLEITVINSIPDNFGSYAGDDLGDDWQIQYFGLDNPDAAPALDPDGDGQDNRFEFIAGLIPTDPLSRFLLRIVPDPVEPGHMHLIFSPIVAGRVYTVESATSLAPDSWSELTDPPQSDTNDERTVTDTHATGPNKFYHVGITKP